MPKTGVVPPLSTPQTPRASSATEPRVSFAKQTARAYPYAAKRVGREEVNR